MAIKLGALPGEGKRGGGEGAEGSDEPIQPSHAGDALADTDGEVPAAAAAAAEAEGARAGGSVQELKGEGGVGGLVGEGSAGGEGQGGGAEGVGAATGSGAPLLTPPLGLRDLQDRVEELEAKLREAEKVSGGWLLQMDGADVRQG